VLVACDLSNIEMRLFAAYAGNGRLLEAVRRGEDLHTLTAKFIGIKDRKRAGGYVESGAPARQDVQLLDHLRRRPAHDPPQQRVNQDDARLMRNRYYDAYPEVKKLQNRIEYQLHDQGYIKDLWGRRYRCDDPRKEDYKFTNYLVQGTAAEVLKEALVTLHKQGVPGRRARPRRDLAHVPKADAPEAAHLIEQAMTQEARPGGKLWLPENRAR
jgi:DNA polymerase-1